MNFFKFLKRKKTVMPLRIKPKRDYQPKIFVLKKPLQGKMAKETYETIDGKWWLFIDGLPERELADNEAANVIWGNGVNGMLLCSKCENQLKSRVYSGGGGFYTVDPCVHCQSSIAPAKRKINVSDLQKYLSDCNPLASVIVSVKHTPADFFDLGFGSSEGCTKQTAEVVYISVLEHPETIG